MSLRFEFAATEEEGTVPPTVVARGGAAGCDSAADNDEEGDDDDKDDGRTSADAVPLCPRSKRHIAHVSLAQPPPSSCSGVAVTSFIRPAGIRSHSLGTDVD